MHKFNHLSGQKPDVEEHYLTSEYSSFYTVISNVILLCYEILCYILDFEASKLKEGPYSKCTIILIILFFIDFSVLIIILASYFVCLVL